MLRIKESSGFLSQTWGELCCPCSGSSCLRWKGCITLGEANCQDRPMIIRSYATYFQINEVMCVKIRARKTNPCCQVFFVINLAWIIKFFIYILLRYNFGDVLEVKKTWIKVLCSVHSDKLLNQGPNNWKTLLKNCQEKKYWPGCKLLYINKKPLSFASMAVKDRTSCITTWITDVIQFQLTNMILDKN